jgi:hypothetical protein
MIPIDAGADYPETIHAATGNPDAQDLHLHRCLDRLGG